jgi:hypothetical protein
MSISGLTSLSGSEYLLPNTDVLTDPETSEPPLAFALCGKPVEVEVEIEAEVEVDEPKSLALALEPLRLAAVALLDWERER